MIALNFATGQALVGDDLHPVLWFDKDGVPCERVQAFGFFVETENIRAACPLDMFNRRPH